MKDKERVFTRFRGSSITKRTLQSEFKHARLIFDKKLRNDEREFRNKVIFDIESSSTDNPRQFWDHLKRLGGSKCKKIPMEVYDDTGNILCSDKDVLNVWHHEYSFLYRDPVNVNFDDDFHVRMKHHKVFLESGMEDPLYESNAFFNKKL